MLNGQNMASVHAQKDNMSSLKLQFNNSQHPSTELRPAFKKILVAED